MIAKKRLRFLAFIIDAVIYFSIFYFVAISFGVPNEEGGYTVSGMPAFLLFLSSFLLWPISETLFGQTLGKRFLDIKVVGHNEENISVTQAFLRFFFGLVDYMFLSGVFVAMSNDKNQRIGDLIAKTKVIKVQ